MPRTPLSDVLEEVGGTLRLGVPHRNGRVNAVLVVGNGLTSHFWLNILPLCPDAAIRYYITEDDLEAVDGQLHVRPAVVPSFVVLVSGYPVDWFPAPLPAPGHGVDPYELLEAVRGRVSEYR